MTINRIDIMSPELHLQNAAPPEGLSWPKATEKAIKEYITAYESYDAAILALQEAEGELEAATAADTIALANAVASESPDPGTPNEDKANRALQYASERVRQKYRAASDAQAAMVKQIKAEPGDVAQQALKIERERIERLNTAHAKALEIVEAANREFSEFGSTANGLDWVGVETVPGMKYAVPLHAPGMTLPQIDAAPHAIAAARLDAIEAAHAAPTE